MANPSWPATLPQPIQDNTAQYAPLVDNQIRTSMETGAPKSRRRFTYVPETFNCTLKLTGAQVTALRTFVETTLQDVDYFDWLDFRTMATATYQFTKRPTFACIQTRADAWLATLQLVKVAG